MHLYVLEVHNFHILISTIDLPIVTNALKLLPMFCQKFLFYQFVPIMTDKDFIKNMVHW